MVNWFPSFNRHDHHDAITETLSLSFISHFWAPYFHLLVTFFRNDVRKNGWFWKRQFTSSILYRIFRIYRGHHENPWKDEELTRIFETIPNKTPGYLRDILRPPTLLKIPFRRMVKAFFFLQNTLSSSYFLTFPTLNFFWLLQKNLKNKVERQFQEKIPWDAF